MLGLDAELALDPSVTAFFLDLDGTLIELAARPDEVQVDGALLQLVERLALVSGGAVALVSGRSLADLDGYLQGLQVTAAGQHGLERRHLGVLRHADAAAALPLTEVRRVLQDLVTAHRELQLEDKGMSLALHYRGAPRLASWLHHKVRRAVAAHPGLAVMAGKRVLEVKPAGVDKGGAIAAFLAEAPFAGRRPVFVGDDTTDEYAFGVVNRMGGISIKVGLGRTCAAFRCDGVAQVRDWLTQVTQGQEAL